MNISFCLIKLQIQTQSSDIIFFKYQNYFSQAFKFKIKLIKRSKLGTN